MPKIYLSPSNQSSNTYSAGNTNEMEQCNRIADYAKKALERCDFSVKKAPKGQNMTTSINESNNWGADLHIPIHTNAGGGKGVEVFLYNTEEPNITIGNSIYKKLVEVSPSKTARYIGEYRYGGTLSEIENTNAIAVYCECEFHDNESYAKYIINNAKKIGEAICEGVCDYYNVKYIDSETAHDKPTTNNTTTNKTPTNNNIKNVQNWINKYYAKIDIDGIYGPETKQGLVKALQKELNKQYDSGLVVDGIWGPKTREKVSKYTNLRYGHSGNITKTLQGLLICNGYSTGGFDGIFGSSTKESVKKYQNKKGIKVDGIAGADTFEKLCS